MPKMKLADWARENGISYLTANRHFHAGMIPNAQQLDSGTILVDVKDELSEQSMTNSSNDAMSFFLKKTVEFSNNGASVEDFAAFVLSNFQLKMNGSLEGPKYSRQKPKSEEIQKHFQQFIPPKGEKPKPNSFVMDPEAFEEIPTAPITVNQVNQEDLLNQFTQAVNSGSPVVPRNYAQDVVPGYTSLTTTDAILDSVVAMSPTESTVTRSVDLNTTPQPINYTGSNNLTFSGSSSLMPNMATASLASGATFSNSVVNTGTVDGIVTQDSFLIGSPNTFYFDHNTDFLNLPKTEEAKPVEEEARLNQPRKRGRKPSKR